MIKRLREMACCSNNDAKFTSPDGKHFPKYLLNVALKVTHEAYSQMN